MVGVKGRLKEFGVKPEEERGRNWGISMALSPFFELFFLPSSSLSQSSTRLALSSFIESLLFLIILITSLEQYKTSPSPPSSSSSSLLLHPHHLLLSSVSLASFHQPSSSSPPKALTSFTYPLDLPSASQDHKTTTLSQCPPGASHSSCLTICHLVSPWPGISDLSCAACLASCPPPLPTPPPPHPTLQLSALIVYKTVGEHTMLVPCKTQPRWLPRSPRLQTSMHWTTLKAPARTCLLPR